MLVVHLAFTYMAGISCSCSSWDWWDHVNTCLNLLLFPLCQAFCLCWIYIQWDLSCERNLFLHVVWNLECLELNLFFSIRINVKWINPFTNTCPPYLCPKQMLPLLIPAPQHLQLRIFFFIQKGCIEWTSDTELIKRYCLYCTGIPFVIKLVREALQSDTARNNPLTAKLKRSITLAAEKSCWQNAAVSYWWHCGSSRAKGGRNIHVRKKMFV